MSTGLKITAFCPTLNRPELLGHMIACFENQTYQNRELVILDDSGQYNNQSGDRWELISVPRRFRSLGEKNNAVMAMASRDSDAYAKADDDDIYMPWWLESLAEALRNSPIVQPHVAVDFVGDEWAQCQTWSPRKRGFYAYHGCWAFRREVVEKLGGYRPEYAGDDQEFQRRFIQAGYRSCGIHPRFQPFYWYNRPLANRISERGGSQDAYFQTKTGCFVGAVPRWTGERCWERPIPEKIVDRPW